MESQRPGPTREAETADAVAARAVPDLSSLHLGTECPGLCKRLFTRMQTGKSCASNGRRLTYLFCRSNGLIQGFDRLHAGQVDDADPLGLIPRLLCQTGEDDGDFVFVALFSQLHDFFGAGCIHVHQILEVDYQHVCRQIIRNLLDHPDGAKEQGAVQAPNAHVCIVPGLFKRDRRFIAFG